MLQLLSVLMLVALYIQQPWAYLRGRHPAQLTKRLHPHFSPGRHHHVLVCPALKYRWVMVVIEKFAFAGHNQSQNQTWSNYSLR
jgi:hypothetical protein